MKKFWMRRKISFIVCEWEEESCEKVNFGG